MTQIQTESSLSTALLDMLGALSTTDRANFWHMFANTRFPSLSEPLAEAVRLAAGVELVASQSGESTAFLAENPALAVSARARLGAIESLRGDTSYARNSATRPADTASALEYDCGQAYVAMTDRDFPKASRIFDSIDVSALEHPSMRLLYGYALCQIDRWAEGHNLVVGSIESLRRNAFGAANSGFWRAFSLIGDYDPEFAALVAEIFARNIPSSAIDDWAVITQGLAAQGLYHAIPTIASLNSSLHALRTVAEDPNSATLLPPQRWLALATIRVGSFEKICSLQEQPDHNTTTSLDIERRSLARLQFAIGNEDTGLDLMRQARASATEKRDIRSLRVASTSQLPSIPSIRKLVVGAPREIPPSPITRVDGGAVRPRLNQSTRWVAELTGASVVAGHRLGSVFWYVATQDDWLLADGLNVHPRYQMGSAEERMTAISPGGRVLFDAIDENPTTVPGKSILLGGVANYYHWLMEYLPKLAVLENLTPAVMESDAQWIVNADVTSWQTESLSLLGVPGENILPTRSGAPIRTRTLTVPSMTSAAEATAFLRRKLDADRQADPNRKLYISRLDTAADRRRIHEEEALAVQLQQAGFEIILPSEMSFMAQVEAFAEASVIVGPHGAGLTNIAFAPRDSIVIEITNSYNHTYNFFSDIADAVGCTYARYSGGQEIANHNEPENASSVVNANSLQAFIASLDRDASTGSAGHEL